MGSDDESHFILGMGKIGQSVKILLDIDCVLASDEDYLNRAPEKAESCD